MPRKPGGDVQHVSRDIYIYFALALTPMTVRQLFDFLDPYPPLIRFTTQQKAADRIRLLLSTRCIRKCRYHNQDPYYTLTQQGYDLLEQEHRQLFRIVECGSPRYVPFPDRHQKHGRGLADIIVTFLAAAQHSGIRPLTIYQENRYTIDAGVPIQPDFYPIFKPPLGRDFHFAFEYHRPTRRNKIPTNPDAWPLRCQLYEAHRRATGIPFRVLVWTETEHDLTNILSTVKNNLSDSHRPFILAALKDHFLAASDPLFAPVFLDHFHKPVALFPPKCLPRATPKIFLAHPTAVC